MTGNRKKIVRDFLRSIIEIFLTKERGTISPQTKESIDKEIPHTLFSKYF